MNNGSNFIVRVDSVNQPESDGSFAYSNPANFGKVILSKDNSSGAYVVSDGGSFNFVAGDAAIALERVLTSLLDKVGDPTQLANSMPTVTVDELIKLKKEFTAEEILELYKAGAV